MIEYIPDSQTIKDAHNRIAPYIHNTPLLRSTYFNELIGAQLYFKCENFQKAGSFKMRGASNYMLSCSSTQLNKGFATHSSGNHGQAVALASQLAETKAYIVMPHDAPKVKIDAVQSYGAEISFCEPNEAARIGTCSEVLKKTNATFIHPFDDYNIIAGQATAAKEIFDEGLTPDFVLCPVGGGGLASGTVLSTKYFCPSAKVILCEPQQVNDTFDSLNTNKLHPATNQPTIADGLRSSLGKKNFDILKGGADTVFTVSEEEIIEAMRLIWERMKIIIEPSCAVPLAALIKRKDFFESKKIAVILTGGNVDLQNLPF